MVQDGRGGSRSLSPPERTAARAARTRTFEAILHDQNRFSYFLDYLSVHAQAHKLLFWFEIEQFKLLAGDDREMASHQETIFEKYFGLGARGGAMGLELPQYAVEHTEVLYSKAKRRPIGYMFDVAQAFVYQELRDRWLPQFRSSVSHTAMLDQMRVSYPVSLPQLLAEGPFNYCLNNFIYDLEECPTDLRVNYQIWLAIQSVLRPLCSSALQKLDQRGITWASKDLSSLEKEGIRFMETYVDGPNVVASILDEDVKFLIGKRVMGLTQCKPGGRDGILGVGAGSGKGGASYAETLKATVSVLNDALLAGQEQAYRALEAGVIPALTKSNTFGNFVDDLSALEARLRLLNDWADVQRKLPEKAVESTAGGRTSHLLRPCPTPVAPDVWPIASSKAGGVFGGDGRGGKDGRGRVVRAGGGADVTCPSLLFVFQVDTEETTVLLDTEDSVVHGGGGGGGGGISGHTPRGLHGCAALVSPLKTTSRRVDPSGKRYSGPGSMRRRESARPPPSMGAGNPGMGGGSTGVFSSSFPSPKGKMLRRFRTKVRQLRHVVAARVLQDTPSGKTGGGTPSVPEGEAIPKELDLLAGMASDDTDYRKVRSRLNGQILELIAADVTEWLPRYCLPSAIARVETKKKNREHKEASPKGYKEDGNPQEASPSGDVKDDFPAQQPRVHHFVMTVPRKRSSPPASPGLAGHPSGGSKGRRERGNAPGGPSGRPGVSGRTSPRRWGTRPVKGSFPLAIDRESNLVLHAACATVWRKLERREEEEDTSTEKKYRGKRGGNKELVETTAYVPRCVCALSFDPLFDTLRAVALARGGFPEAGRALMLDGVGGGAGDRSPAGGGGTAKAGGLEGVTVQWGLGDAATLQAAPPPLPIISAPPAPPAPTLPTIFAPATRLVLPLSGRGVVGAGVGTAAGGGGGLPSRAPPLVLAVSAPESTGGWSVESEGDSSVWSVGTVEMGAKTAAREAAKVAAREAGGGKRSGLESDRWSSFGLPPLVPLDHPVEPLFQALSSDNVLLSLSALLCERPVVVTCSVRSLLSVAVSSLKTLLHPLGWHHAYAPLLPATEVMGFWKSKMLLDKRSALSQGRSGSPPRITPQQWGSTAARAAEAAAGGTGSTTRGWDSPERSWRQQTPFLVGLEGELVRMACGKPRGVFGNGGGESRKSGGGGDTGTGTGSGAAVWGVVSSESCMMPPGTQGDAMGVATTQPRSTLLEVVRLMLRQSVHVDLDHDEVTWPPPAPPSPLPDDGDVSSVSRRTISSSGRKWGGGSRAGVFFEDSGERASSQSGGKGGEGAPPGWPEEAARQAKRVIQFTLFPEFEDFDAVSPTPPERVEDRAEDDSALFKCSRSAGGGPEVSLKKKIEAIRNMSSFDKSKERNGVGSGIGGLGFGGMGMGMGMRRGMASKMTESVVGMYVPTQADLALRAAAAGLVASVLGRVKEFTTLFAQAGLLRFDTAGFVAAVASDSRNTLAAARGSKTGVNNNNLGSPGLGGGVGSATASSGAGSSPARVAGVAVAGQDDDGSPVVVESTAEDGESAEGAGGEGRPTVDVSGTEMCLQVVRTRAFAALLSDEVFSDVDLEALQAELKLHSVQIRDFLTASQ